MATYDITSPDGQKFRVNAPDDATQEQVMAYAQKNFKMAKQPEKMDATEGMSTFDKVRAGFGKAIHDTAQGLGQMVGLTDRADVEESRRLNADLMKTTAGKVGDFAGNVATTLPLAFVPGANTVKGASLLGALTGLIQPSTSTQETLTNTGLGGAIGGGSIMAGRGLAAAYQGATGLLRPLTGKGQEQIASDVLQASATDTAKAIATANAAKPFVKGATPTVGQLGDDGLAQLERTLYNKPETQGPLAKAYAQQQAARKTAIADIAGTPGYLESLKQGRATFAREDYNAAKAAGIDGEMSAALQPQIESLMRRPTMKKLAEDAKIMAADKDIALTDMGSVDGLHWMKKALDRKITGATNPASPTHEALDSLLTMKSDLMSTLEQVSPLYKVANDNFAQSSKTINAMEVAKDLQKRLYKNADWGAGKEMGSVYQTELSKALESVKKQTGMNKTLNDVMPVSDIATLEGIAKDLARKETAANAGRATGSNTMQNMMGQNLINRVAGPLGVPQSFSQNVLANTLSRPYNFVMQSAEPRIQGLLSEAMADPKKAAALLSMVREQSKMGLLAGKSEKFLSMPGLLALENGN